VSSRLVPGRLAGWRRTAAVTAVALLTAPSPALAASSALNPFSPGVPVAPVTSTASAPTVNTNSSSGASGTLSGGSVFAIAVGAVVVLGGISFFIWRDARRRAPVPVTGANPERARPGSKTRPKQRKLSAAEKRRRKRGRAPRR